MADGADRVLGEVLSIADRIGGDAEASTGPHYAEGKVWGKNTELAVSVLFEVNNEDGRISLLVEKAPGVAFDDALELIQGVWRGAAGKGFPNENWKY